MALLVAGVEGARARNTRKRANATQDCYSKYDGKTLLSLKPCTPAESGDLLKELHSSGCAVLDESRVLQAACEYTEVLCDREAGVALEKADIANVVTMDAGAHWRQTSGVSHAFSEGFGVASDFYSDWRDLDSIMARVEAAVQASGGAATLETAGQSLQGRDIKIVRFRGQGYSSGGTRLFVSYVVHAREWVTAMAGVYAVEELAAKVREDPDYLAGTEVVLMPMANPDGFVFTTTSDRMHRKNMANVGCSRNTGVDLNRNFDSHWGGSGSSGSACSDTYRGPSAMSEPESKVIARVMNEAPMTVYIDVHSYTQLIISSYGWTTANHPRRTEYRNIGKLIQTAIRDTHGITFTEGATAQTLYTASGITIDYADDLGALGICFELRPGRWGGGGFAPPRSEILPAAEESYAGMLAAIDYAKDPSATPAPPAPTPAPAPTPDGECPSAYSSGPDSDGDCRCHPGRSCSEDGSSGCTYSYTASRGYKSRTYFLPSCSGCRCE